MKVQLRKIQIFVLLFLLVLSSGCIDENMNQDDLGERVEKVNLLQLLETPEKYLGEQVKVEGILATNCYLGSASGMTYYKIYLVNDINSLNKIKDFDPNFDSYGIAIGVIENGKHLECFGSSEGKFTCDKNLRIGNTIELSGVVKKQEGHYYINITTNFDIGVEDMVTVEMKTSEGTIVLELDGEKSPIAVENFLNYVNDEYYDGLIFHRVIDGFMIQGGGFEPGMKEKDTPYPPIENEARKSWLENKRGTIAMARTNDPDSATSQFFINLADNEFLNLGGNDFYGYAVFGKVVSGMDVVDSIAKVKTHSVGMSDDVPVKDVVIESVKVSK